MDDFHEVDLDKLAQLQTHKDKIVSPQGGTRQPLGRRYDLLFEEFGEALDAWAEICHYGEQKHGNKNWWKLDFNSEQNPLNHAIGHLRKAAAAPPGAYRRRQLGKVLWNVAAQLWYDSQQDPRQPGEDVPMYPGEVMKKEFGHFETKCSKCETPLLVAPGIGPYCPNKDCDQVDWQPNLQVDKGP